MLARDGATVTLAGRTESKLQEAAAALAQDGLDVRYAVCDGRDGASVRQAVDEAGPGGRLDIAVVVPGLGQIKPILLYEDEEFGDQVLGNVDPVWLTLKWAGRAMVRNGSGSFVAISSTAAVFSTRYLASYAAGKAAVDQLVRVAADELGQYHVRVNSVRPGLTRTPATEGSFRHEPMMAAFLKGQPLARGGQVDDVAAAVRYLAGPESSWVTGQHITVDGGHTLRAFVDYAEVINLPDVRAAIDQL